MTDKEILDWIEEHVVAEGKRGQPLRWEFTAPQARSVREAVQLAAAMERTAGSA